jgi:hypothetical protein
MLKYRSSEIFFHPWFARYCLLTFWLSSFFICWVLEHWVGEIRSTQEGFGMVQEADSEKDPQAFICHFYNVYFAHTAGDWSVIRASMCTETFYVYVWCVISHRLCVDVNWISGCVMPSTDVWVTVFMWTQYLIYVFSHQLCSALSWCWFCIWVDVISHTGFSGYAIQVWVELNFPGYAIQSCMFCEWEASHFLQSSEVYIVVV